LSSLAGNYGLGLGTSQLNAFLGSTSRQSTYDGNRYRPNLLPPIDDSIRLWHGGIVSDADLAYILQSHGVKYAPGRHDPRRSDPVWSRIIGGAKGWFQNDLYRLWYRRGILAPTTLDDIMRRQGFDPDVLFTDSGQSELHVWRDGSDPLPWTVILDQYFRGLITEAQARQLLKESGITDSSTQTRILESLRPIDLSAAILLTNRGVLTQNEFLDQLDRMGYREPSDHNALAELLKQIPGPSDLVRFALREVWDPDVVREFGYDDEFPEPFKFWLKQQGLDWSQNVPNPGAADTPGVSWPLAYWRSHWQTISPGQAYEMLHRLRPDVIDRYRAIAPDVQPFTIDDVRRVLKIADYPKPFRDRLAAISYRVIGIRQIRTLVANRLWGQPELIRGFQDQGYSPADSDVLATMSLREVETRRLKSLLQGQKSRVLRAYELGVFSRLDAEVQLYAIESQSKADYDQYLALPLAEQRRLAAADSLIQSVLDSVDADTAVRLTQTAIAAVRKGYLRLELTQAAAEQALQELGLTVTRINEMLSLWRWEFFGRGKSLAVGQIQKLVARGLASPAEATLRLQRLGYPPVDALALVQLMLGDYQNAQLRAQQSLARTQAQQQRALIAQQRELKRQLTQIRHDLAYNAPIGKLKKWLAKGLISIQEARMRMTALGHDAAFITREITDATTKLQYGAKKPAERIQETPLPPSRIAAGSG